MTLKEMMKIAKNDEELEDMLIEHIRQREDLEFNEKINLMAAIKLAFGQFIPKEDAA